MADKLAGRFVIDASAAGGQTEEHRDALLREAAGLFLRGELEDAARLRERALGIGPVTVGEMVDLEPEEHDELVAHQAELTEAAKGEAAAANELRRIAKKLASGKATPEETQKALAALLPPAP
jgi:hypothetical protein